MDSYQAHRRLIFLSAILFAFALLLVGRLIYWQVVRRSELIKLGRQEYYQAMVIPPERGEVLDHQGYPLAMDIFQYEVFATPKDIPNARWTAEELAPLFSTSVEEMELKLSEEVTSVTLAKMAPLEVGEEVASLGLGGVGTLPFPRRAYPESSLACHILGFVGMDGKGFYGLEGYYDDILVGQPGVKGAQGDSSGESIPGYGSYVPAKRGPTLVLTLDRAIQEMAEEALIEGIKNSGAEGGTIIVMNPRSGALLAIANYPCYDPNRYYEVDSGETFKDPAISVLYEPGSAFKVITMAAALDTGTVTPQSTYNDTGSITVGGRLITNAMGKAYGETTMTQLLSLSLNVGAATLNTWVGWEKFYQYVRNFGFGETTGVDLAGEIEGIVRAPGDPEWHEADLGTNAFGQGIAVTALQMANSVAVVANGGYLMKPYIVERIIKEDGTLEIQPVIRHRAISSDTARTLTQMMVDGVENGIANLAKVPGYSIAAKTGTAQIPIPGGYDPQWTIASIVGFAPAEDPRFLILVKLDKPTVSPWGASMSAPVFKSLAEELFTYFDIPPDEVRLARR